MAAQANILLVEDNPADQYLTLEAFKGSTWARTPHVVKDGVEALSFLEKAGAYSKSPRPDLIILDLNLPRKDGREVLRAIKQDPKLKYIPVIILSTSEKDQDILSCYGNHANCYIVKPVDVQAFFDAVHLIEKFWLSLTRLPSMLPVT